MQKESFKFHMPTEVRFEAGLSRKMSPFVRGESVLIISDPFLFKNGTAEAIGNSLTGKRVTYFSDIEPNPSCESVDAAAALARESKVDCVVGIGGGSSMDVSKIVSCLATNPGSIYDYYSGGSRSLGHRTTQLVCIPTTAGTGSEVTNVGVFTNRKTHVKMPMVNNEFWPDCSVIDPELTYTLPPAITASTGMDAFCHAIEAYWNKDSQPMCDMISLGALKLILENIKNAYDHPEDKTARAAMILASLTAGVSFSQTRTTGIHAVSFPLTAEFGASHGTACSITLPAFIRISTEKEASKMLTLAQYLGYPSVSAMADGVEALMRSMKMPVRLHELGVQESDIPHLAQVGLTAAIIQLTPAEMNQQTVEALLRSIL
ncbi:MAG: iron-containing alcohol dehydrogenase family protein [Lawsonibacter sp.]